MGGGGDMYVFVEKQIPEIFCCSIIVTSASTAAHFAFSVYLILFCILVLMSGAP